MTTMHDLVFLFDVDNTLLDNDRVQADLATHLTEAYGVDACKLYGDIFEQLRRELGYADYLGALERFRLEKMHDPRVLRMSSWLVDYPFADRLYAGALNAIKHVQQWGSLGHPLRWRRGIPAPEGRALRANRSPPRRE
jgi:FMN phosphatase YigB (HAD superfamily)